MNTKMYVGNLSYDVTEQELKDYFAPHGGVDEVNLVMDRETGRPRGFAFVQMTDVAGMEAAIRELDGKELNGRSLKINEARPRENRPSGDRGHGGGQNRGYGGQNKGGGGSRKGGRDRW